MISIDRTKCTGCRLCVSECVVSALRDEGEGHPPSFPAENEKICLHCQHCLAVCPVGAVRVDGIVPETIIPAREVPSSESVLSLLRRRRSIRRFEEREVPENVFAALENALRYSPTGCNDHRLRFVIVKNRGTMVKFRTILRKKIDFLDRCGVLRLFPRISRFFAEPDSDPVFRGAPHMIVALTPKNAPCAAVDPVIALAQFEIYAATFGIGCCWCGFAFHAMRFIPAMKKLLEMPKNYRVGYVLLFGYPATRFARPAEPPAVPVASL